MKEGVEFLILIGLIGALFVWAAKVHYDHVEKMAVIQRWPAQ